jgi:O-acetyl-ADP-ribose deacetylase (regulator of RNase III)
MIRLAEGNLLDSKVDALVNTVNTVGVMGKGIALMFRERFSENYRVYAAACRRNEVQIGRMFVTERAALDPPRWIVNFPTKQHWRGNTKLEWIELGLHDLRRVIRELGIRSIALPPLGCGNGGLDWSAVRPLIERELRDLSEVDVIVFQPTGRYQNVVKPTGVEQLTVARALVVELVRRYWILGIECSLLEIQKLAWFLEQEIAGTGLKNPLNLQFQADRYGPYADRLRHLLNALDGSYLHASVRLADAKPTDTIAFDDSKKARVEAYLKSEAREYLPALQRTADLIDGFESPLGVELLATVDWLLRREKIGPRLEDIKTALADWAGGQDAGARKLRLFDDRLIELAIERLTA